MTEDRITGSELLGEGEYESRRDLIMRGFKLFQKKYVFKRVALQIVLVIIAGIIQAVNILTAGFSAVNGIVLLILLAVAITILSRPRLTYNKLEESISGLDGIIYKAQMYSDKVVVSTIFDPAVESEGDPSGETGEENTENEAELPPATIIHLDQGVVDILCTEELFVVYIKGSNMYVIPRDAFGEEGSVHIARKYEDLLGTHFILC
ncbi:MAG: hypothetical protein J6F31_10265 [Oscillospiraceae bacterium]|nr:hypothetical protein [Oscillospiraceae bacterium]